MDKKKIKQAGTYLAGAVMTILVVWILAKMFAVIMVSPDDIGYKNILSGSLTGTPDAHCYFIKYPLAVILAAMYRWIPSVSWYEVFLMACNALCLFLIYFRAAQMKKGRVKYFICATFVILFLLAKNVIHLEWTVTAGLLGATALFRFITIPRDAEKKREILEYVICGILLLVGFCLRDTVIYMFVPLAFLVWVQKMIRLYKKGESGKQNMKAALIFFLVSAVLAVGVRVGHRMGYSDTEWTRYKSYTKDRSVLFDFYGYPNYDRYEEVYKEAGISREIYNIMVADYNYVIPCDEFREIDLKKIADLARSLNQNIMPGEKMLRMQNSFAAIYKDNDFRAIGIVLILLMLIYAKRCAKWERESRIGLIGGLGWLAFVAVYLSYKGRFPVRVAMCAAYGLLAVFAANLWEHYDEEPEEKTQAILERHKVSLRIVGTILVVLFAWRSMLIIAGDNISASRLALSKKQISMYCSRHPENLYLRDFASFSQRGDFFMDSFTNPAGNYVSTGGWTYNTPLYNEMLTRFGCEDVLEAIREKENIYYMVEANRMPEVRDRLNAYFKSIGSGIVAYPRDGFDTENEHVVVLHFKELNWR